MRKRERAARFFVCAVPAVLVGIACSPWVTAWVTNALLHAKVVGYTTMILAQLAHDVVPLAVLVLAARGLRKVHQLQCVVFVALAAILMCVLEPLVSQRLDTVAAAWQGMRLIARLSAFLFAITAAAYFDSRRS